MMCACFILYVHHTVTSVKNKHLLLPFSEVRVTCQCMQLEGTPRTLTLLILGLSKLLSLKRN